MISACFNAFIMKEIISKHLIYAWLQMMDYTDCCAFTAGLSIDKEMVLSGGCTVHRIFVPAAWLLCHDFIIVILAKDVFAQTTL